MPDPTYNLRLIVEALRAAILGGEAECRTITRSFGAKVSKAEIFYAGSWITFSTMDHEIVDALADAERVKQEQMDANFEGRPANTEPT